MNFLLYIYVLLPMAIIDAVWLLSTGAQYKKWLGHLFADQVNFVPAVIFYLLYAFGILFFVVTPSIKNQSSLLTIFLTGALLGALCYATYDLTNHATMRNWPLLVTVIDIAWGAVLTGTVATIAVLLGR